MGDTFEGPIEVGGRFVHVGMQFAQAQVGQAEYVVTAVTDGVVKFELADGGMAQEAPEAEFRDNFQSPKVPSLAGDLTPTLELIDGGLSLDAAPAVAAEIAELQAAAAPVVSNPFLREGETHPWKRNDSAGHGWVCPVCAQVEEFPGVVSRTAGKTCSNG